MYAFPRRAWEREKIKSSNDGAHPREKGYEILANFIKNWSGWWFKD